MSVDVYSIPVVGKRAAYQTSNDESRNRASYVFDQEDPAKYDKFSRLEKPNIQKYYGDPDKCVASGPQEYANNHALPEKLLA